MRREKPVISTTELAEHPSAKVAEQSSTEAVATVSYHKGNNKSPLLSLSSRSHSSFTYMALEFPTYETGVSYLSNCSFTRMELECQWGVALEFHPYEPS